MTLLLLVIISPVTCLYELFGVQGERCRFAFVLASVLEITDIAARCMISASSCVEDE